MGGKTAVPASINEGELDLSARWVRVKGTKKDFILFDFTLADPVLTLELIMPYPAFAEFRRAQGATLKIARDVRKDFERLARAENEPRSVV
jgi:phenol hydroxylase P0 protein